MQINPNQAQFYSKIYLYGCRGHGKVILDILKNQGRKVEAFVDDYPPAEIARIHGVPIYSASEALSKIEPNSSEWIVSIGDNQIRQKIVNKLIKYSYSFATAIHPSAQIAQGVTIDKGTVVMANAVINTDVYIGKHAIVNTGATIDHDCYINDYCHVAPGCSLCGQVKLGKSVFLGVGTKVCPNLEIGEYTTCGAGSVVVRSLKSYCLAYGCPATIVSRQLFLSRSLCP